MATYTDITVLLDRSGSMEAIQEAMVSAFDEFVRLHRAVPSTRLTLIQFDTHNSHEVCYLARPIAEVPPLRLEPRAQTPLLDAVCEAIDETGRRLKTMLDADRPDQVLMLIVTDGAENASRRHSREDVRTRIAHQTDTYRWQFLYLGANQDAFREAASLGIHDGQTMAYAASPSGVRGMAVAVAQKSVDYALNVNRGTAVAAFDDDDRSAAAGEEPLKKTP